MQQGEGGAADPMRSAALAIAVARCPNGKLRGAFTGECSAYYRFGGGGDVVFLAHSLSVRNARRFIETLAAREAFGRAWDSRAGSPCYDPESGEPRPDAPHLEWTDGGVSIAVMANRDDLRATFSIVPSGVEEPAFLSCRRSGATEVALLGVTHDAEVRAKYLMRAAAGDRPAPVWDPTAPAAGEPPASEFYMWDEAPDDPDEDALAGARTRDVQMSVTLYSAPPAKEALATYRVSVLQPTVFDMVCAETAGDLKFLHP